MKKDFHQADNPFLIIPSALTPDERIARLEQMRYTESVSPLRQNEAGGDILKQIISFRYFRTVFLFFCFCFFVFVLRGAALQLFQGEKFSAVAEKNRIRILKITPERGLIVDRNKAVIAGNRPQFVLTLMPADLPPKASDKEDEINKISSLTGLTPAEIQDKIQKAKDFLSLFEPVVLLDDLDYNKAVLLKIESEKLPGLSVDLANRRTYALKNQDSILFSHLIGYVGYPSPDDLAQNKGKYDLNDSLGKAGLEQVYDDLLRGKNGQKKVEIDARGKVINTLAEDKPVIGETLRLSLDAGLQKKSFEALSGELKRYNLKKGAVIVMNPQNGEILAMVSLPSYDNEKFLSGFNQEEYQTIIGDPNQPLFNRAVAGEYPPGSTFKLTMAAAGLEEGIITPTTSFLSVGGLRVGQWFFPDWKAGGHGWTNVQRALAESINTLFYILGGGYQNFPGLGLENIIKYARLFGFGQKTGIDLPNEKSGFLPTAQWKENKYNEVWYIGDTYHLSIGQGYLLVTPLQLARETAVIANGGELVLPHLRLPENEGDDTQYILKQDFLKPSVVETVKQGLRQTVVSGSARSLSTLPVAVAGKTGTAQWQTNKPPHAWFTGFVPYDKPEIVVTVLLEQGVEGSTTAVPVAREIINWWYQNKTKVASNQSLTMDN